MNKIVVISPFYNVETTIQQTIASVLSQKYDDYEAVFFDDGTNDKTFEKIQEVLELKLEGERINVTGIPFSEYSAMYVNKTQAKKITLLRRTERQGAMANWTDAVCYCCDPDDIVVSMDGDDTFINKKVVTYVDEMFTEKDIWFMYGGCKWTDGRSCCSMPYSEADFQNLRKAHFKVSMMRCYKAGLYQMIAQLEPGLECFRDENGEFYKSACDVAMVYPMLEMAGLGRIHHNTKPVYVYNRDNEINDDKVDQEAQWRFHAEVLKKHEWDRIDNYLK